ncbi:MAG: cyclic nucleotide-binding domain-containing protein, partial [Deltaproteobacteria bacterium]|nr:cyclic nucleotide-binding domain-containing protein [Deltaproteobacteria bacterium]
IVLTLVPNMVIPILNFLFNFTIDQAFGTEGGMLKFFGYFRGSMNIVSFVVLLFVGRIYGKWGLPIALMFHPANYVIAFLSYLFYFNVYAAIYSQLSTSVLRNTINNPARAVLMGLFPPEHRSVVRPFLRGTVVRIGILMGSGTIMICQGLMHPRYISIVAIIFVSIWVVTTFVLKKKYSSILLDLISRNLLDLKSLEEKDVSQVFLDKKVQSQMVERFLSSRGRTCLWYARLLQSLGVKNLDEHILTLIKGQDDETVVDLLALLSENAGEGAISVFVELVRRRKPEVIIAVLRAAGRMPVKVSGRFLKRVFDVATHPEIRAYAVVGLFRAEPDTYKPVIDSWLASTELPQKRAGIISAGGSGNREYVALLLDLLRGETKAALIALLLEALCVLRADGLNELLSPYLRHPSEKVRRAALEAVGVSDDNAVRAVIPLLGDSSEAVRDQAATKLQEAPHQNSQLLIESLVAPNRKLREGIFSLLESLQIRDVDVLRFARSQFERGYTDVAEAEALGRLEEGAEKGLLLEHLLQKKRERVEAVLRVLAAQDRTGRMRVIHRGIFSTDARQRANAIEAMEDTLGNTLSKAMVPLLEDLSPAQCLEQGRSLVRLPQLDSNPGALTSRLLAKQDWVTVVLTLHLAGKRGLEGLESGTLEPLLGSADPRIRETVERLLNRSTSDSGQKESTMETGISIPDKILHLRSIHIFEGLAVSELAAIASVTEEVRYSQGSVIIKEGETGETMFMIIEGEVAVIKGSEGSSQIVLDHIRAGDYFGEMALFEDLVRSATIRSEQETRVLVLHKREFTEIVREYPLIALGICRVLSQRLRKLHEKVQSREIGVEQGDGGAPTKH